MKACSKCKEIKDESAFNKDRAQRNGLHPSCRECIGREFKAKYWSAPEWHRERTKKWNRKNPEKKRAANREYYYSNPETCRANTKRWYENNTERVKNRSAKWNKENPKRRAGTVLKCVNKRRAEKAGASIIDLNAISKWERLWRNKPSVRCYWCQSYLPGKSGHSDHIKPLSKGGPHGVENLCISCPTCNTRKHARDLTVWNSMIAEPVLL